MHMAWSGAIHLCTVLLSHFLARCHAYPGLLPCKSWPTAMHVLASRHAFPDPLPCIRAHCIIHRAHSMACCLLSNYVPGMLPCVCSHRSMHSAYFLVQSTAMHLCALLEALSQACPHCHLHSLACLVQSNPPSVHVALDTVHLPWRNAIHTFVHPSRTPCAFL